MIMVEMKSMMQMASRFSLLTLGLTALSPAVGSENAPAWQIIGATYNSVAFLDRASIRSNASVKVVRTLRVSGQPEKDGWRTTKQSISVDCANGMLGDAGSVVEKTDGNNLTYGPTAAKRPLPDRGIFARLYEAVCNGREGTTVTDPKSWTGKNFKPGQEL
jgi:hypothetical protein